MVKKLSLLGVFLLAVFAMSAAQTTIDPINQAGLASLWNGGILVQANATSRGFIYLYTGPVSLPVSVGQTSLFPGTGGWFEYNIPKTASPLDGLTWTVSGSLYLQSYSNTVSNYTLTLNFSGVDANNRPFYGSTTQLIKIKVTQNGASITDVGGSTVITTD